MVGVVVACSSSPQVLDSKVDGSSSDGPRSDGPRGDGPRSEGRSSDGPAPACGKGEWCWENPLPHGNTYHGVAAVGATLYAVGAAGSIVTFDGKTWRSMPSGTTSDLRAVWAFDPASALAVGEDGVVLRLSAGAWAPESVPPVQVDLLALWASGADDVVAVGEKGTVLRRDGTGWSVSKVSPERTLSAVWGESASSPLHAVGASSSLFTFDRATKTWTAQQLSVSSPYANGAVTGLPGGALFVAADDYSLWRWDPKAATWAKYLFADYVAAEAAVARSASEVYLAGGNALLRFDGFQVARIATVTVSGSLQALVGAGDTLYLAGASGAILRHKGGALDKLQPAGALTTQQLNKVWGRGPTDVYAVGDTGVILHHDGKGWTPQPSPVAAALRGLWGTTGLTVAVGSAATTGGGGTILHNAGSGWKAQPSPAKHDLHAVWGSGPSDIYAVGEDDTGGDTAPELLHFDGTAWSAVTPPAGALGPLRAVWGSGAGDVYAVGGALALHFDGTSWSKITITTTSEPLTSIWGRGPNDIYVGTAYGNLFRFGGSSWQPVPSTLSDVRQIYGDATTTYAVGRFGGIARNDGSAWVKVEGGTGNDLQGIWSSGSRLWVVGSGGAILTHEKP